MIIIVGAGLAGLAVAYKLKKAGYDQFKIIEAKPRVGGRIESVYDDNGSRLDLGAQWLHGERENPIYGWLKDLDCIEGLEDEEVEFEGLFRCQTGREPDRKVVFKVLDILMETKGVLYKMSSQLDPTKCRPVDMYHERINSTLRESNPPLKDTTSSRKLVDSVVRWFELYEMIDNSCENFALLSMKAYSCWSDFDDGKMVKLKGGWQNVVNKLVDFVGRDKIQLGCPVKQIDYSTGDHVDIICQNNSTLRCDHVIVTLSVGALKYVLNSSLNSTSLNSGNQCDTATHYSPFLNPGLDAQRVADINAIGFGVANKIFLEFERPYLQQEKGLKLLWSNDDDPNALGGELPLWARCITGFDVIDEAPNYLLAWIGAYGAHEMEEFSEQEVGSVCLRIFSLFIPEKRPPRLVSVKRSCWSTDPYIRGSYSYQSIDLISKDTDHLWDPICCDTTSPSSIGKKRSIPRVMFAGEATAGNLYSTAHGAIVSGWREADRLIEYTRKSPQ